MTFLNSRSRQRRQKSKSEASPVTINDYFLYCILHQTEIGSSIFGHLDYFKNIKRKYVFEILYGIYDIKIANLQENLRDIKTKIRISSNQDELLNDILAKTILENRDEIEHKLLETKQRLVEIEKVTISTANDIDKDSKVSEIKKAYLIYKTRFAVLKKILL